MTSSGPSSSRSCRVRSDGPAGRADALAYWQRAGVWKMVWAVLLDRLAEVDQLDWSRAALDSSSIPAKNGEPRPERIRRIKANRDRSAMLWSMPREFHSR